MDDYCAWDSGWRRLNFCSGLIFLIWLVPTLYRSNRLCVELHYPVILIVTRQTAISETIESHIPGSVWENEKQPCLCRETVVSVRNWFKKDEKLCLGFGFWSFWLSFTRKAIPHSSRIEYSGTNSLYCGKTFPMTVTECCNADCQNNKKDWLWGLPPLLYHYVEVSPNTITNPKNRNKHSANKLKARKHVFHNVRSVLN